MKFTFSFLLIFLLSFFAFSSQKTKKVAIVKLVRGDAEMLAPDGAKGKIKKDQWLTEGTIVTTSKKSFVRLKFIDKSSMNIGPKSSLKIEKFSKDEAGVINVLTGKIRSQVTKNYLEMDKEKSKLYVKSKNAVMGVRGTDFMFTANKATGAATAVLFEGSIIFNKIKKGDNIRNLEEIVSRGRFIKPGEVSVAMRNKPRPTVPAKLNKMQFTKLEKNQDFEVSEVKNVKKYKSKVPPGLSGDVVASDSGNLKDEIKKLTRVDVNQLNKGEGAEQAKVEITETKGFIKGEDIKPADGVMVHLESGTIIPPGIDSQFDPNAGEWVSSSMGGAGTNGEYVPPEGFTITDEGQLLKVDAESGKALEVVVIDIKPVDEMPTLDQAPTVEYIAPTKEVEIGPSPAGTIDNPEMMQDEFESMNDTTNPDDVKILEDGTVLNPDGTKIAPDGTLILKDGTKIAADGTIITKDGTIKTADGQVKTIEGGEDYVAPDDGALPPPPKPEDSSTTNQPTSFIDPAAPPPPPPGKGRINLRVNKQ